MFPRYRPALPHITGTNPRPCREPFKAFKALTIMKEELFHHYPPDLFQTFILLFTRSTAAG